ncbi:MAG: 50S ribosomal protein L2 [Patescibacteria group bacterium]|nr:50S ribosomal protein L2 [Patescibacteria group bacterium]MDD5121052.1 50S ribosomal protein L2 [Patescibacteria group bacterium]MDD5221586.1 50S ribosomal protein L2 [Patescibacteria group bacterium]MDD5396029.1 50S ribosomal protein L2 [Patescibacteria group bacterium]
MMLKFYKPTTPGRRQTSIVDTSSLTKKRPEKSLTVYLKEKSGRNNQGQVTLRHQGGGMKKLYRQIDFKQNKFDLVAKVIAIEYDPNRTAWIALICFPDGEKRYVLAPHGLKVGDKIVSSLNKLEAKPGNRMPLKYIPTSYLVHSIELTPGEGAKIVRSAGSGASLMTVEGGHAQLKLPSGEVRLVSENCCASVGQLSNVDWHLVRWGKAGRMRLRGIRPSVRGKAMNPVDHPHGGGEGHQPIGLVHPKTPWGKPALGVKTRNRKKWTNKFILKRRK